jgi:hypothetical protein
VRVPNPDAPPITRGVVLRAIGLTIAVALAGVAAWLVVTGNESPRRVQLGVLAGLWSALLAGFALYGARRSAQFDAEPGRPTSTELELRSVRNELERAEEAAARRAHEARLEQLLRAEVQAAISREVTSLRAEIAELRGELLEKVGNQVRLERIETTRVIGSDLEALQHEVRQLQAVTREVGDIGTVRAPAAEPATTLRPIVETARVRPVSRETAEVQADVQPATSERVSERVAERVVEPEPPRPTPTVDWNAGRAAEPEPPRPTPPPPADLLTERAGEPEPPRPTPPPVETTGPIRFDQSRPAAAPEPPRPSPTPPTSPPPAPPEREPVVLPIEPIDERVDTLSGLPRIEPFTDFELDPIEDEPAYTGRRRRGEGGEPFAGRHSRPDGPGRRHRDDDEPDDLLARLLAREHH